MVEAASMIEEIVFESKRKIFCVGSYKANRTECETQSLLNLEDSRSRSAIPF